MIVVRNNRKSLVALLAFTLAASPLAARADGPLPSNPQEYDVPAAEQYLAASERALEQFVNRLEQ
ncbi:MAG: hypothetical protein IT285_02870, partial [Bdellovibrionales bacterium]|nr:hypothetical protein [Bdellovibrionales bacterium]